MNMASYLSSDPHHEHATLKTMSSPVFRAPALPLASGGPGVVGHPGPLLARDKAESRIGSCNLRINPAIMHLVQFNRGHPHRTSPSLIALDDIQLSRA